jgi:CBS domain-containing protein
MSNSPTPEGEDPADLLDRTNLAAYLSARKQLAAENSTLGLPTRPVLPGVLRTDETVSKAMELLSSLRVQAAPLVAMHADNQHYDAQAFISCGDLVLGFLERVNSTATATLDANVLDRMAALTAVGQAYSKTPLVEVRSRWDGTGVWSTATEDMSLADALRRCMHIGEEHRDEPGSPMLRQCPHRFAVIDASGMVVDIVAQSDLAMYLRRNADLLDQTVMNATVQSMQLGAQGGRRVVSVNASTPVVDCFYEMERANVQAVAIIDENTDALVGNLSETDIMTLKSDAYGALALPVGEYLLHAHGITNPKVPDIVDRSLYNPDSTVFSAALANEGSRLVVTCEPTATIAEVMDAMHVKAVHRVWVVDDARRPIGVVALSDILAAIAVKKPGGGQGTSEGTIGKSTMHANVPTPTSQSSA